MSERVNPKTFKWFRQLECFCEKHQIKTVDKSCTGRFKTSSCYRSFDDVEKAFNAF